MVKFIKYFTLTVKSSIEVLKRFTFKNLVKHFTKTYSGFPSSHMVARSPVWGAVKQVLAFRSLELQLQELEPLLRWPVLVFRWLKLPLWRLVLGVLIIGDTVQFQRSNNQNFHSSHQTGHKCCQSNHQSHHFAGSRRQFGCWFWWLAWNFLLVILKT